LKEELNKQISQMTNIYSGLLPTLFAAVGNSSDAGFAVEQDSPTLKLSLVKVSAKAED
jgi:hypothetical protein